MAPNRNYERGVRFERELMHRLEIAGYTVYRTAGSHGQYDLIAFHYPTKIVQLWQCKTKLGDWEPHEAISEPVNSGRGWIVTGQKITKFIRRKK